MKKIIYNAVTLLFLVVFFTIGKSYLNDSGLKIINGHDADKNSLKYFVALGNTDLERKSDYIDYNGDGGAELIAPNWILTAAHVLNNFEGNIGNQSHDYYSFAIRTSFRYYDSKNNDINGKYNENYDPKLLNPNFESRTVDHFWSFPSYENKNINTNGYNYDIGLLHLTKPITDITPLKISAIKPTPNTYGTISGFGWDINYRLQQKLQTAQTIINSDNTMEEFKKTCKTLPKDNCINTFDKKSEILTSYTPKTNKYIAGSAQDSGGPLVENNVLYGTLSRSTLDDRSQMQPEIWTFVGAYIPWIQNLVQNQYPNENNKISIYNGN